MQIFSSGIAQDTDTKVRIVPNIKLDAQVGRTYDGRPDAARITRASAIEQLRTAAPDEKSVYRKWLTGAVVFYGAIAFGLAVLAAGDRPGPTKSVAAAPSQSASLTMNK